MNKRKLSLLGAYLLIAVVLSTGCGGSTATPGEELAETKAKADEVLNKMTEKFKSAPAVSFTSVETADRPKRGGKFVKLNINRDVTFKSPDRMHFKATGDRDLEAYYDGKSMILVTHKEKVWGQLPAPATIGETIEKIREHYGMPLPVADLLGMDAKGKLRNPANTGGIEKTETIDGVEYHVLAYQNPDVDWKVWIPVSGDPLPKRFEAKYKETKGASEYSFEFSKWNLAPQITDDTFVAKVPDNYEGIPVIQRASAVIPKIEEEERKAAANSNANAESPEPSNK